MKKLLFQLDTDIHPAVFDTVVAYDGGADHVIGHGNVSPENVTPLIEGTIFTRAPKEKQFTAIFVGGSNMVAGQELFKALQKNFFGDFREKIKSPFSSITLSLYDVSYALASIYG